MEEMDGYTPGEKEELLRLHDDLNFLSMKYQRNGIVDACAFIREMFNFTFSSVLKQDISPGMKQHFLLDTLRQALRPYKNGENDE